MVCIETANSVCRQMKASTKCAARRAIAPHTEIQTAARGAAGVTLHPVSIPFKRKMPRTAFCSRAVGRIYRSRDVLSSASRGERRKRASLRGGPSAALRTTEGSAVRVPMTGEGFGKEWESGLGGRGFAHYVEDVAVGV